MHHVFISYAREDATVVDRLVVVLRHQGVPIWLDRRDIPVSVRWWEEAKAGINGADLFVVCSSAAWTASVPCGEERDLATATGKAQQTINLAEQSAQEAAGLIIAALNAVSPDGRLHTEIVVQTAIWKRAHRAPSALPSRQILRQGNALVQRGLTELSIDELEFLRVATQRHRRGWWRLSAALAAAGVIVLLLCMTGILVPGLGDRQAGLENSASTFLGTEFSNADPYTALASAAQLIQDGQSYNVVRTQLVDALSVHVPAQSWTAAGMELLAFGAGEERIPTAVDNIGITVDSTGRRTGTAGPTMRSLSRSSDGRVQIRTTARSSVLSFPRGHLTLPPADQSAVSADGRTALVITGTRAALYALPETTPVTVTVPAHCCTAAAVAGERAILGTRDGHLVTFSATQPPTTAKWRTPSGSPVAEIAVSADGRQVAVTTTTDGAIRLLSGDRLTPRYTLAPGPVDAAAFSPDSRYLAVGTGETVTVFDVTTGQTVTRLIGSIGAVRDVAWSPDSATISAVTGTNRVVSWPWRAGTALVDSIRTSFIAVTGPIRDGRIAAVDRDGTITVIDPTGHRIQARIRTGATDAESADWAPGGSLLAIGTTAHGVRLWRPDGPETTVETDCPVTGIAINTNAKRIYTACGSDLRAYDAATRHLLASATAPSNITTSIRVASDGTVFLGDAAGDVLAFGADLARPPVTVTDGCGYQLTSLDIDNSGQSAVAAGDDANECGVEVRKDAGTWHTSYAPPISDLGTSAPAAALRGDDNLAAFGFADGTVHLWLSGTPNGDLVPGGKYRESGDAVRGIAYTTHGDRLVIATSNGLLEVLPGCPMCGSNTSLANEADSVVAHARTLGLYTG